MQAQLLPVFLLTMPLALCFLCLSEVTRTSVRLPRAFVGDALATMAGPSRGAPPRPAAQIRREACL
jgi:hypothetical protein